MSESHDMLKTEEGQLNEVFARFGLAAQHAQLFEEALGNFLLAHNKIFPASLGAGTLEEFEAEIPKRTMGSLLREVNEHLNIIGGNSARRMDDALLKRNHLMHHFFLKSREKLETEEGRMDGIKELEKMIVEFKEAHELINKIYMHMRVVMKI